MTEENKKKRKRCGNPKPTSKKAEKRLILYKAKQSDKVARAGTKVDPTIIPTPIFPANTGASGPWPKNISEEKKKEDEKDGVVSNSQ